MVDRIAVLNHPSAPAATEWNSDAMSRLRELGFTSVQLNLAWGPRPADEPLGLEDFIAVPEDRVREAPRIAHDHDPVRLETWRATLRRRYEVASAAGLRTIVMAGLPYNAPAWGHPQMPHCISDPTTTEYYEAALDLAYEAVPADDLWVYTYDNGAWLCSEFECPLCLGVPLAERLTPFLERIGRRWHGLSGGRIWWEPWELSAGQTISVIDRVDPDALGLSLHNNTGECMVASGGDRIMRNAAARAQARGIPVVVHAFLGSATEEVEPYVALQSPLATYDEVRTVLTTPGLTGIKEYYGIDLSKPDPNLDAALLALDDPGLDDDAVLRRLSEGYGEEDVRRLVEETWREASRAMQTYPWDASWFVREIGRADLDHAMTAAVIRGEVAPTPAWRSTRGATFQRTFDGEDHPWLLEDLQLRWQACADLQERALDLGSRCRDLVAVPYREAFGAFLDELAEFRRRVLSYVYHCRETNLATVIRTAGLRGQPVPDRVAAELADVMRRDRENGGPEQLTAALAALDRSPLEFAATWFLPEPMRDRYYARPDSLFRVFGWGASRGNHTATSG